MATISSDILARYAADASREVDGVRRLIESPLPRQKGVRVLDEDGAMRVELHLEVEWGRRSPRLAGSSKSGWPSTWVIWPRCRPNGWT